jgi:DNA-binding transcriptional ArsR family regulator
MVIGNRMVTHYLTPHRAELTCVLKAVADPNRRRIISLLAQQDLPVSRIAEHFKMSRPAVIKHLHVLRSAKLISVRPCGRERIQCLEAAPLEQVERWISQFESYWDRSLRRLKRQIEDQT